MDVFGYNPSFTPPIETITKITFVSMSKRGNSFTVRYGYRFEWEHA